MKAKRSFKKYMTKGYRHVRYTKGFGVHSPYAFSLITQVINEKMYYYAYDDIRRLRKYSAERRFKIKRITLKKKIPSKKLFLIYRLVNNFNPKNILQIGSPESDQIGCRLNMILKVSVFCLWQSKN